MHTVRKEDLPLVGSSYNFVGAEQEDISISMFLVEAPNRDAEHHCITTNTMRWCWCRKATRAS